MVSYATRGLFEFVLKRSVNNYPAVLDPEQTLVAIAPGGGNYAVSDPRIKLVPWERYTRSVVVCGTRGDPSYTIDRVERLLRRQGQLPDLYAFQESAANTLEQATWVAALAAQAPHLKYLVLSTAEYHLPRFALTVIKSMIKTRRRGVQVLVLATARPEVVVDAPASQTVEEELERIERYQKTGHVAALDEAYEFFAF